MGRASLVSAFFAVDFVTGQEMIRSIGQMQTDVTRMLSKLDTVDRRVSLGDLEEARAVASFNQMVASGDAQSARAVLEKFRESLNNAAAAVRQGMANYREVEAATEHRQKQIHDGVFGANPPSSGTRPI
jgi:hypothetical protein